MELVIQNTWMCLKMAHGPKVLYQEKKRKRKKSQYEICCHKFDSSDLPEDSGRGGGRGGGSEGGRGGIRGSGGG